MTTKLNISIALISSILCVSSLFGQSPTKYTVTVPSNSISKDILELATGNTPVLSRYVVENGYEITLGQKGQEAVVRNLFESQGVSVLSVTGDKTLAISSVEKAGGNNCSSAEMLCSTTTQTANSSGPGVQELNGTNQGCLGIEHQSSWYYVNVQTGGNLTMTINPANNSDDYDFAIWGPFTSVTAPLNCPPTSSPIRCSYAAGGGNTGMNTSASDNSENAFGNGWVNDLNTSANEVYIMLIDNFSNSGQPYDMSFGGSAVLGCNVIILPVGLLDFSAVKTTNGNMLHWETETEQRADYFTVEWTTNPTSENWQEIGKVYANGTSDEKHSYQLIHSTPTAGTVNYYRLSLFDMDGKRTTYNEYLNAVDNTSIDKVVAHVYNMLGQEVNLDSKGMLIYQYADGSTEKVYITKD